MAIGDVRYFIGFADDFGNARKNFPIVEFYADPDAEACENFVDDLHQFYFVEQRVGAHNVGIALKNSR